VVRAGTAFEEYRNGVPGAIDTLVRLVSPMLWHTARQCGLSAAEAEDVVQQTFMSLVRSKDSISDPLAVVRWLTVSLRRLAWRERANSAKRSGDRPATTTVGAGLRDVRTLPAPAGGHRLRTTT
jgi:DNA-directed RNA polymerase specialized sigma24 family protein